LTCSTLTSTHWPRSRPLPPLEVAGRAVARHSRPVLSLVLSMVTLGLSWTWVQRQTAGLAQPCRARRVPGLLCTLCMPCSGGIPCLVARGGHGALCQRAVAALRCGCTAVAHAWRSCRCRALCGCVCTPGGQWSAQSTYLHAMGHTVLHTQQWLARHSSPACCYDWPCPPAPLRLARRLVRECRL
jgi:hypothetical protein